MSLKAKIEAVIYASEEPVTLAQLVGLLGEEGQAELEALASRQQSLPLEDEPANELSAPPGDETLEAEAPERIVAPEPAPAEASPHPHDLQGDSAGEAPAEQKIEAPAAPEDKALAAAVKQKERALRDYFRSLLDQLIAEYASDSRGLEIREVAGGFRFATKPEYHDAVRGFVKSLKPPLKLSLQALETLAVVAYKQPITAPEISEIRGVDSAGVLGSLMTRKLVTTAGRKQVIGRPILYKTTKDFLLRFGLKDINELPSIEEFEKMAGELNAAVQEEIPMETPPSTTQDASLDAEPDTGGRSATEPQQPAPGGSASSLDEINSAPQPTHTGHDTPEDLMSDKSTSPEGHNREHADPHEVEPDAEAKPSRADSEASEPVSGGWDRSKNIADDMVVDGRISGPPPNYEDDDPSAEEAKEQQREQDQR